MIKLPVDLKKLKPQNKALIAVLCAILLLFYYKISPGPQLARLTNVLSEMGKIGSALKAAESEIGKIDKFKATIEAYKEKVDKYEKRLPMEQEIPSILENLSVMARKSNIKILGITPVPPTLKEPKEQKGQVYQEMPIIINAKSSYHELGQFLSNLENADRFMKVVDIDIKSNKTTPKKHDVELIVSTFILLKER